jgi:hypothetical protein
MAGKELVDRNKEIVRLRVEEKLSYQKIGDIFGTSRERIRQILSNKGFDGRIIKVKPQKFYEKSLLERIKERIIIDENNCWIWQGCNTLGHGRIRYKYADLYVSKAMYELIHGPISKGINVWHLCSNSLCCNPDHLYLPKDKNSIEESKLYLEEII